MTAHARSVPDTLHHIRFPNESTDYRRARNALLDQEMELRRQIERVAARRRQLPEVGEIPEDYVFETSGRDGDPIAVKMSELFTPGKDTLAIYSFMYGPERKRPCPGCTHFLDSLDGAVRHIAQRVNFVVVAKSPIDRIQEFARERGWRNLRLLSSAGNTYNGDYHGETESGAQIPTMNVFTRRKGRTYHTWSSELLFAPADRGQDGRHVDLVWPLWNLLDMTTEGRGATWHPKLKYD